MKEKLGKFVLLLLTFSLLSSIVAYGKDKREDTIALLPVEYKVELGRGDKDLKEYKIVNRTKKALTFLIYPTDCLINRQGGREYPPKEEASKYSAAGWIELVDVQKKNVAYPGDEKKFGVRIRVPMNADPGWYYATIMADLIEVSEISYQEQDTEYTVGMKTRIAGLIKVKVPGSISGFRKRLDVVEIVPIMPDRDEIARYETIIGSLEENKVIAKDIAEELWKLLFELGHVFDYQKYEGLEKEEKQKIAADLKGYFEQQKTKEETVKLIATVENKAHMILLAKIRCFIYWKSTKDGRTRRILRDRFTLTPAGKNIKGEGRAYPGRMRDFHGVIGRPLSAGEYTAEMRVEYRGEEDQKVKLARGTGDFIITEDIALRQREILVLDVGPDLLEFSMVPGGFHSEAVEIENLDMVEDLEVTMFSSTEWLTVSPSKFRLGPGRSKNLRVTVKIEKPAESVERAAKIAIGAERGKPIYVDIVVKDARQLE